METLKDMVDAIERNHKHETDFDLVSYLLKHYFLNDYHGNELDYVFFHYFPTLWWEVTFWLGQNIHGTDAYNGVSLKSLIDKYVLRAKIATYAHREYLADKWVTKEPLKLYNAQDIDKHIIDEKILKSLYMRFHRLDQIDEVKEALALDVPLKELKKQFKKLDK